MKPIRFLLAALAVVGLTACYTSDKPLISDDDGVTPFEKITFINEKDASSKPITFVHDGKSFLSHSDDGDARLHLKPVEGDYYVAQMSSDGGDGPQVLYAYMRIDVPNKVADMWRMFGTKADVRPGLRECKDAICIDDLNAYIAYGKEAIAAGAKADATMTIEVE